MAEAIPFSIVTAILKKLGSVALQEIELVCSVKNEACKVGNTVSTIKAVLLDAQEKQATNHELGDWLEKLNDVVYDADDLLDDVSTEALQRKVMTQNKRAKKVHIFFSSSNQLLFSLKMGHKVKVIRERLDAITVDKNNFHFPQPPLENWADQIRIKREETHSFVCEDKVIGRDNDKNAIVELLMDCNVQENVSFVAIVGIGGLGKTELAKLVYNDEKVTQHFQCKMWVCVSDVFDVKQIAEKIIERAIGKKSESLHMEGVQNDLRREIDGKKYLLVLDDVWNEDRERWIGLRDLLMGGAKGSKILITTRSKLVATVTGTNSLYSLKGLSGEESWSLFKQMAFKEGKEPENPCLVKIGKEIKEKCAEVPLAIRVLGSLLYSKDTMNEWLVFKDKNISKIAQEENAILPILKLSYDHLPWALKQCFAFCRLYPKDDVIYKQQLIQLWVAHEFIQLSNENQDMEDVGDSYFMNLLIRRSFFQDEEIDEFGNIISCKMHDLMHDLAQLVAGTVSSMVTLDAKDICSRTRHVLFDLSVKVDSSWKIPTPLLRATKIRTFFLPSKISSYCLKLEKSVFETIVSTFKKLRVLDMHNLGMKTVPSCLSELRHLRYLDLSGNRQLKTLSNLVTKLPNLQTLKLSGCTGLKELPADIRKLVSLRHLEFNGCDGLTDMPHGLGQMTTLRTLTQFIVGPCTTLSELKILNNLRGRLVIGPLECSTSATPKQAEEANLKGKEYLEFLKLYFGYYDDGKLALEALRPHANLKKLEIGLYGGVRLPTWMSSLSNLVEIVLYDCKRCKHLPKIEQLPCLRTLHLRALASLEYIDDNYYSCSTGTGTGTGNEDDGDESLISSSSFPSSSSRGGGAERREPTTTTTFFPSLKYLYFCTMPNLKGWWRSKLAIAVEDDHEQSTANNQEEQPQPQPLLSTLLPSFPCLLESEIIHCPKLTSMPLQPTVEELQLSNVSEKVVQQQLLMMMTKATSSASSLSLLVPLANLEELRIWDIVDLVTLPEEAFQRLTSLRKLVIGFCGRLNSLSRGMRHLTALRYLDINCCRELDLSDGDDNGMHFQGLRSLTSLHIKGIHNKLESLPAGLQHVTTLQDLYISFCENLRKLPEWIGNLTSLQGLSISNCRRLKSLPESIGNLTSLRQLHISESLNLTSLPEGMRTLTALRNLKITNCSQELNDRCQQGTGEYWPKIAHIPKVEILTFHKPANICGCDPIDIVGYC